MDPNLYVAAMNGDLIYLQNLEVTCNLQSQLTPCQETVLHVATEFHQMKFAEAVVQVCPSLLWVANSSGDTALHIAAREGHADMVRFFVGCTGSSDIETGEHKRVTRMVNLKKDAALHCAVRRGRVRCVKLLAEADPEVCSFVNNADESPLYLSVALKVWTQPEFFIFLNRSSRSVWKVPEIITKYASSSASHKGPNGLTALHPTVVFEKFYVLEEIESLVKWRREMIREGDNLGMTPLHYAAFHGRIEVIKLFLEYDSSAIYVLNKDGESALHVAAFNGHVKAIQELVNCRPDCCNMVDSMGRTALHAAVLGNKQVAVKFILNTPTLARLINKADKDGNTPSHLAVCFKFYKTSRILEMNRPTSAAKIPNDEFLTPFNVYFKRMALSFLGDVTTEKQLSEMKYLKYVKEAVGIMEMHEFANEKLKEMKKKAETSRKKVKQEPDEEKTKSADHFGEEKSAVEVNLLVATLVATVTFAAGFTVPGGLEDKGEDQGLATLTNKAAFKVFLVFNTLAFSSSTLAVLFHFRSLSRARIFFKGVATFFTSVSIVAMMFAFCFGTYVVLTKSSLLSVLPFVIPAFSVFLYPTVYLITGLIKQFF